MEDLLRALEDMAPTEKQQLLRKAERLGGVLGKYSSAVIAFSGGVDSTFLARAAKDALSGRVILLTATSHTYPFFELDEAKVLATRLGMEHRVINSEEIDIPGFSDNPPDRCYYCKTELFTLAKEIAGRESIETVFDGSTADDVHDYRPGRRALKELGIVSPLCDAGLTKEDIRAFSRAYGLPTADKASFACLASRFPYGEQITREKLDRAAKAEWAVRQMGFSQFRVRNHDNLARLEFAPHELDRAWSMREELDKACRDAGYIFVSLDLRGYRMGAMNEALNKEMVRSEST